MFRAVMSDSGLLRDSVATVSELIDEGIFKVDKDGVSLLAADRAMVAVVDLRLPATVFDKFEVDVAQNIPINMTNFVSVLKRINPGEKLEMELKDNKLHVKMEDGSVRRFTVPLLDISQEDIPPISQLEFNATARIKSEVLKNGIEDAEIVSDSVVLKAEGSMFNMRAVGDISSSELTLEKKDKSLLDLKVKGEIQSRYPLDYLKKIIKASKLSDETLIQWSKDYPMRVEFKSLDKVSLAFVLAPRVSEE